MQFNLKIIRRMKIIIVKTGYMCVCVCVYDINAAELRMLKYIFYLYLLIEKIVSILVQKIV